jgi:hypothetical protein
MIHDSADKSALAKNKNSPANRESRLKDGEYGRLDRRQEGIEYVDEIRLSVISRQFGQEAFVLNRARCSCGDVATSCKPPPNKSCANTSP